MGLGGEVREDPGGGQVWPAIYEGVKDSGGFGDLGGDWGSRGGLGVWEGIRVQGVGV